MPNLSAFQIYFNKREYNSERRRKRKRVIYWIIRGIDNIRENITPRGDGNNRWLNLHQNKVKKRIRENITPRGDGNHFFIKNIYRVIITP